jgi:hypothetical protein
MKTAIIFLVLALMLSQPIVYAYQMIPDFAFVQVWNEPATINAGDKVIFHTRVQNQGTSATNRSRIECYLDGDLWANGTVHALSPNAIAHVYTSLKPWTAIAGPHTVTWMIDTEDRTKEFDETNNIATLQFNVEGEIPSNPEIPPPPEPTPTPPPEEISPLFRVNIYTGNLPETLSTKLWIDGVYNATLQGRSRLVLVFPKTDPVHIITVEEIVPYASGIRWFCQDYEWPTRGRSEYHKFNYYQQFYLDIQTEYANPVGSGWYREGTYVRPAVDQTIFDWGNHTRAIFDHWSGDAKGTGSPAITLRMDKPKTAVANWRRQYFLEIMPLPIETPLKNKGGWYDVNSTVVLTAETEVLGPKEGERYVFISWVWNLYPEKPTPYLTITMDSPRKVGAIYNHQYYLNIKTDPPNLVDYSEYMKWYDEGSVVTVRAKYPTTGECELVRFLKWKYCCSVFYETEVITISIDRPTELIAYYSVPMTPWDWVWSIITNPWLWLAIAVILAVLFVGVVMASRRALAKRQSRIP